MKKTGILLIMLLLTTVLFSCTSPQEKDPGPDPIPDDQGEKGDEDMADFSMDITYGQIFLKWKKPEGTDNPLYEVAIESTEGEELYRSSTWSDSLMATNYAAFAAQENGYYKEARFHIYVTENGETKGEYLSEAITLGDFFPEKKELEIGTDLKREDIYSISYSGNGEMASDNFGYSLLKTDEGVIYSASYIDALGSHDLEKKKDDKTWEEALTYLDDMKIERKTVTDPQYQMLDGSEKRLSVDWFGRDDKYSYYRAVLPKEDEEALIRYLTELR